MTAASPIKTCTCCGSDDLIATKVLWQALVQEWRLAAYEVQYIDRQQGLQCRRCGSNLRTMALALAICRCFCIVPKYTCGITMRLSGRIQTTLDA